MPTTIAAVSGIDDHEQGLPIPHGEYDVPLIVGDAMFTSDGSLLFDNHDESGMFGDVILVNGRLDEVAAVDRSPLEDLRRRPIDRLALEAGEMQMRGDAGGEVELAVGLPLVQRVVGGVVHDAIGSNGCSAPFGSAVKSWKDNSSLDRWRHKLAT